MLDSFEIRNFRGFGAPARIPIKPITVVVGQNSAGKSSVIASLLTLKQTMEDPAYGVQVPILRLNGSQIDAGTYSDVVHNHAKRRRIQFTFHFSAQPALIQPAIAEIGIPRLSYDYLARARPWLWYAPHTANRLLRSYSLQYSPEGKLGPSLSQLVIEAQDSTLWFTKTREIERMQHWRTYASGLPRQSFGLAFSERSPLLPRVLRRRHLSSYSREDARRLRLMERCTNDAATEIARFLSSLRYVGPFRTPPKRRYTFSGIGASETGHSGEQAIDLLILESVSRQNEKSLLHAVQFWMRHIKLADAINIEPIGNSNLFEMRLRKAGTARLANIADVGFGVSQVLPVIVQGLLVPVGGTFIVQQPELHLHPDAQAGLVDFFVFLASRGIRCLVETHSEYFLVRLRRRLAEPKALSGLFQSFDRAAARRQRKQTHKPLTREDVAVLLVEPGARGANIREAVINDLFQLENLPAEFMSQSLTDRLALARAMQDQ